MTAFCTPDEIREQVREVVECVGSPAGGLMVSCSVGDANTPLENIDALCQAMEDYCLPGLSPGGLP